MKNKKIIVVQRMKRISVLLKSKIPKKGILKKL